MDEGHDCSCAIVAQMSSELTGVFCYSMDLFMVFINSE